MNNSHNSNTPANLTGYPDHEVVEAELVRPGTKKKGFRNIFETLLDPQTLQTLMWCGSGLLVIGLMIWLWSVGVFENALFAAVTLGGINLVGLGAGIAMVLNSIPVGRASHHDVGLFGDAVEFVVLSLPWTAYS